MERGIERKRGKKEKDCVRFRRLDQDHGEVCLDHRREEQEQWEMGKGDLQWCSSDQVLSISRGCKRVCI